MIATRDGSCQLPLIHCIESDDLYLQRQEDVLWFHLLRDLDWRSLRQTAARYYEALWQFNVRAARAREARVHQRPANPETKSEATRRLLFERATMCEDTPALHELPAFAPPEIHVDPRGLRPGVVPPRWSGKRPKCFFALFAAFMGVMAQGRPGEPEIVHAKLQADFGIELLAPINPRNRKPLRDDLPRGVDHITPTGTPVCRAGYPFDFVGCRHDTERFLFRAPQVAQGVPVCRDCPLRAECYRGEKGARQITVPFERLPWIDPKFPQLSQRFALAMADRTAIERLHKLMKPVSRRQLPGRLCAAEPNRRPDSRLIRRWSLEIKLCSLLEASCFHPRRVYASAP